ncbi:MAG: PilZ domain-containing protein [Candidatus Omnitrophota bacterium]
MNSKDSQERRRYPRIARQIPLRIKHEDYDFVSQTRDISCLGAYCTVNKHIPVFSIISIILLLPLQKNRKNTCASVRCKGVVVRIEKDPKAHNQYNIAIYFNNLRQSDKAKLSQYVQQYL